MKTISIVFAALSLAVPAYADDQPVKKPAPDSTKPAIEKPAPDDTKPVIKKQKPPPDPNKPVVKKPDPDPTKPVVKKPPPDPNKPVVKKPDPDPTKPVVKKPPPDPNKPLVKKPGAGGNPGVKKPGAGPAKMEFTGILNRCDDNKDGSVSLDEFRNHQGTKDPASVTNWFNSHDRDKNGLLTAADFAPPPAKT